MHAFVVALALQGQTATLPTDGVRFSTRVTSTVPLNYLLHLPEGYDADSSKRWPLVLFLHGAGERGADLEKNRAHGPFKELGKGRKIPAIVIAPQCPTNEWWPSDRMVDALKSLLNHAERTYRVDKSRVLLTGLSMGGFGSWALGMEQPKRFAAIAPICGAGDVTRVGVLKDVPIWTIHGEADNVVPAQGTRDLVAALKTVGGNVRYDEPKGVGHDSWTAVYENDAFWTWLLAQKR